MSTDPAVEFAERAMSCTRCSLSETRQRVVVGSGPFAAPLALVGEAPGRTEDEGGAPFLGRSGQLLFALIFEELGLTREQCYVTNVVKCRPPNNRVPRTSELAACRAWWLEQRTMIAARVIITLGNTATRAVLETSAPIAALRGRRYANGAATVVPTYHPAAVVRGGREIESLVRDDLRVAARVLAETAP